MMYLYQNIENKSNVPILLRMLNILTLFPIIVWPFLFFHVDDMMESSMKYKWPIFIFMLVYPLILIGNIFLTTKLYKLGYKKTANLISIMLAIIFGYLIFQL
jgi:hypothetical protein